MKFLGRAKKFLQVLGTEPEAKTQYFNVTCAAGHRVRGERTEGYQALRCPACGEGVFVLPRNPLPVPVAPAGVTEARGTAGLSHGAWVDDGPVELTDPVEGTVELDHGGAGAGGAEIIWDDEPREAAAGPPRVAPEDLAAAEIDEARRAASSAAARAGRRAPGRTKDAAPSRTGANGRSAAAGPEARGGRESRSRAATARPVRPGPEPVEAPAAIEVRRKPRRGPRVGLIFFLLALLIVASIGWRALRNRRQQYPMIIERGRDEGLPALNAGDFDHAYQLLSAAKAAVDALGGVGEDADKIRNAANEAAIFVNLCPDTLEDMLAEAGRIDPDAWASKFETLYKGRSYIFDTLVESTPQDGDTGAYEIAYVVFPPGEASRFGDGGLGRPDRFARVDLAGFELLETTGKPRDAKVTFGAKLQSIAYDAKQGHWVVRLEPKSGVYITHYGALRAIGWPALETVNLPPEERP